MGKFAVAGAAALVGATVAIGAGLLDLAKDAAPLQGISNAFKALANSAGQNSDKLLASMEKASMGMVTDSDLMLQYNKSAQLVGGTLAGQLPDAYQYLAKVAASSGQDVGQLMDTLVNGVGRVTPKMMTQLGVTVDMDAANKSYAASIGKNVDQLTKADKQTAIFNATMAALKKNTAGMPDVTQNASTKMAQFNTKLADAREHLGTALLPMLGSFTDLLSGLADRVLPIITPIIESLGNGFGTFFQALSDGVDPLTALGDAIFKVFGQAAQPIADFLSTVSGMLSQFFTIISNGRDPFMALGITILDTFHNAGVPLAEFFLSVSNWIQTVALPAITAFKDGFVDAFGKVRDFVVGNVLPGLNNLYLWFTVTALPAVRDFVVNTLKPDLEKVFTWLSTVWDTIILPGISKMYTWFTVTAIPEINKAISDFKTLYFEPMATWLSTVWDTIILPGISKMYTWFTTGGLQDIINGVLNFMKTIGDVPGKIQDWIDKQGFLAQRIEDLIIAIGIGIVVFGAYNGLVALAGIVSTAAATGIGAMQAAIALMLGPLGLAIIAITALIALYHQLQTFQQQVSSAVQGSLSPTAQAIKNGLTHDQYMDKAFASSVSQMGDAGARIFWANGGQTLFERTWQTAYAEAQSRDSGGPGKAGSPYMIGKGAQPEMFIPSTNGTFVPNADKAMGGSSVSVESLVINASGAAEGAAAGHAFLGVLDEWQSRGNR